MNISYNRLKDLIEIDLLPQKLAHEAFKVIRAGYKFDFGKCVKVED